MWCKSVGFVRWLAPLLILRSVGIFLFFCLSVYGRVWFFTMTPNVQQLGDVAVFQHQAFANIDKFSIKKIPF